MDRVTTYLELNSPAQLRPSARQLGTGEAIVCVKDPDVNRRLYTEIGASFEWTDRLPWGAERWAKWADGLETWVLRVDGEEAGYAELQGGSDGVLVAIFGLRDAFRGRGLGGAFLTAMLRRGLELDDRVWVETNSTDGPPALANYEARGMTVFRTVGG